MQYIGFLIGWLHSTTSLLILGTLVICLLSVGKSPTTLYQQLLKTTVIMVVILLISGLFLPSLQAISLAGDSSAALNIESIKLILFSTRFGAVWAAQESLSILLLLGLYIQSRQSKEGREQLLLISTITLSSLILVIGVFKGHAAGLEPAWPGLLGHGIHLLAAGSWLGALPALFFVMYASSKQHANAPAPKQAVQLLTRFSILARIMVGFILLSGTLIGYLQIDRWGELFATAYGQYLMIKVLLFIIMLMIAGIIRQRFLPQYSTDKPISQVNRVIAIWVLFESSVGLILLGVANAIKNTTPASHEEITMWPFDFRFSLEGTWEASPSVQTQVFLGFILIALAIGLTTYLLRFKYNKKIAFITGICLLLTGVTVALQPLAITAYPDTYRNSTVPYDAISIRNGADIFSQHCAACHGVEGKGDGVLTDTLDVMLMDLNQMHSVGATAGDMYWSFTQERFKDPFHSPIAPLDEDEIWELINYLNAQTISYTSKSLYTYIEPQKPFLGAPDFYYSTDTTSGNLKDFREDKAILLVLFSWPEGKNRLEELKRHYKDIAETNTEVIAVEITKPNNEVKSLKPDYPFIVVTEQTESIVNTYTLFRRSFLNSSDFSISSPLKHIEFMIDRFGYLRARWLPEANTSQWSDFALLNNELKKLADEPEILPPPDEHVH
ncbi:MAG: CopD family protein [Cycloclasticus sp.]|nr:CopD family protein [Cycloclasticus sp.]